MYYTLDKKTILFAKFWLRREPSHWLPMPSAAGRTADLPEKMPSLHCLTSAGRPNLSRRHRCPLYGYYSLGMIFRFGIPALTEKRSITGSFRSDRHCRQRAKALWHRPLSLYICESGTFVSGKTGVLTFFLAPTDDAQELRMLQDCVENIVPVESVPVPI